MKGARALADWASQAFGRSRDLLAGSPIGVRLARGAFWSLVGISLSRMLALLGSVVVARLLGKTGFGELGMIQSTVGMFSVFAGFGLGISATKHVAEYRATDPNRVNAVIHFSVLTSWVTGLVSGLALFLCAAWLARAALAAPHLVGVVQISALLLLLGAVNGGQMGTLAGFEAFRRVAAVNLWSGVSTLLGLVIGVALGGLMGGMWGLVIAQGATCVLARRAIVLEARSVGISLRPSHWCEEIPMLWRFNLPTTLTAMLGMPVTWFCQALLARQPGGYAQVAEFYGSMQMRNIALVVAGILTSAVLPVYTHVRAGAGGCGGRSVARIAWIAVGVGVMPLLVGMALFAAPILSVFGRDFVTGTVTLQVLLISVAFESIVNTQVQLMTGEGEVWSVFHIYLVASVLFVLMALVLVPRQGGVGLAWAHVAMQVARWTGGALHMRRDVASARP